MATSSRKGSGDKKQPKKVLKVSKREKQQAFIALFTMIGTLFLCGIIGFQIIKDLPVFNQTIDKEQIYRSVNTHTDIVYVVENTQIKQTKQKYSKHDLECLAKNIFHEARGTNKWEMIRVANVTMNRVNSGIFPNSVCSVVYQPYQFSWTLESKKKNNPIQKIYKAKLEMKALKQSIEIAKRALSNDLPDLTKGAMWYHTHEVNPKWNRKKEITVASNWHNYYKK